MQGNDKSLSGEQFSEETLSLEKENDPLKSSPLPGGLDFGSAIGKLMAHPELLQMAASVLKQDDPVASSAQGGGGTSEESRSTGEEKASEDSGVPGPEANRTESSAASTTGAFSLNPQMLESIPELIGLIRPLLPKEGKGAGGHKTQHSDKQRIALLLALKPYLSPSRCEVIDKLIRIGKISEVMHSFGQSAGHG